MEIRNAKASGAALWGSTLYVQRPVAASKENAVRPSLLSTKAALRTGPGLGYDRTGKVLHRGESATYLGSTSVDSRGVAWYKVRFDGREGWVSSRYTRLS